MSFPNFGEAGAQPPQAGEEQGAFGAAGAQQPQGQMNQQIDPSQQPGQFPGAPQQGGPQGGNASPPGGEQKTTLWMGELEPWIDENFVRSVWFGMGYQVNVKMIRDKFSGYVRPFDSG